MRRGAVISLMIGVCLWALSAHAAQVVGPPSPGGPRGACCQFGTTYGGSPGTRPSCQDVSPGPGLNICALSGGTLVSGTCHADGACGGSTVCCEVNPTCEGNFTTPCAPATEDACDAPSPAGVPLTNSVTFAVCAVSGTDTFPTCQSELPP